MTSEPVRRCDRCGTEALTSANFCVICGASLAPAHDHREPYVLPESPFTCSRCGAHIDAEAAWHSREAGKALCGLCKQQEMEDR